ncbi:MAG: hypothetical protein IE920_04510 [Thiotrichales bacterium]|nr:hypothetical protein [Thiotrichales bacterium]
MKKYRFFAIIALLPLTSQAAIFGNDKLKQDTMCIVSSGQEMTKKCKEGDVLFFQPSVFGNEQLPINIAAYACNFQYPIVWNKGGVTCIFTDQRKASW